MRSTERSCTRREFGARLASAASLGCLWGCHQSSEAADAARQSRLSARPRASITTPFVGERALGLDAARDGILRVPPHKEGTRLPLIVLLHGAGGSGVGLLRRFGTATDDLGIAVVAPDSRGGTWDAIRSSFGRDVTFLDRVLEHVFERVPVDPARVAVGGFSDGATYALSLGLMNGDLFPRIVAYSPGFIVPGPSEGKPRIFISHGTDDDILPIDRCSRVIVPGLRRRGLDVTYREFAGGHGVPADVAREGLRWLIN